MGATFVPITIAATSGVSGSESGLASGLLNTSQQIGGALGLAILTGVSASSMAHYMQYHLQNVSPHASLATTNLLSQQAALHGYHVAYYVSTFFMVGAALIATVVLKQKGREGVAQQDAAVAPVAG
jgi:hypothetical protein